MSNNKYDRLSNPPGPMFLGKKEKDLVKQINDELIERVISQQIVYYAIDMENTNFHPLYGEAIEKTFLLPIHVFALVEWEDNPTEITNYGADQTSKITINFHKRRITEDQNLYVRVGDFVAFNDDFYEILQLIEPRLLWGQDRRFEITAKCSKARRSLFDSE